MGNEAGKAGQRVDKDCLLIELLAVLFCYPMNINRIKVVLADDGHDRHRFPFALPIAYAICDRKGLKARHHVISDELVELFIGDSTC